MLIQHPHPQVIVTDVLAKLRAYTGHMAVDIATLRQLVGTIREPRSMRTVFELADAAALAKSPPDVSNGLVHIHIMKTAGTSFFDGLQRAVNGGGIWINFDVLALLPSAIRSSTPVIAGHFPYEARKLIGGDRKYLTIIRDPRERTLSHFHNIWNTPDVTSEVGELSLEEFLWADRWAGLASNYQTRQLGFEVGVEELGRTWTATDRFAELGPPFPREHTFPLCSLFDSVHILDWPNVFEQACRAIDDIDVVLTTELLNLAPTLVLRASDLQLDQVLQLNQRAYIRYQDLPQRIRTRIDAINEYDMELWRLARKRTFSDFAEATS